MLKKTYEKSIMYVLKRNSNARDENEAEWLILFSNFSYVLGAYTWHINIP